MEMQVLSTKLLVAYGCIALLLTLFYYHLFRRNQKKKETGPKEEIAIRVVTWVLVLGFVIAALAGPYTLFRHDRRHAYKLLINQCIYTLPVLLGAYLEGRVRRTRSFLRPDIIIMILLVACGSFALVKFPINVQRYVEVLHNGDRDELERLLHSGMDPNMYLRVGARPLRIAWVEGHRDCFQCLLDHGADIHGTRGMHQRESSVLSLAVTGGTAQDVEYLVERGARWDLEPPEGNPLLLAIEKRQCEKVKALLNGHNPSLVGWGKEVNPLQAALTQIRGSEGTDIIEALLDHGFAGTVTDPEGFPLLDLDAIVDNRSQETLLRLLVEHRTPPRITSDSLDHGYPGPIVGSMYSKDFPFPYGPASTDQHCFDLTKGLIAGNRAEFIKGADGGGFANFTETLGFSPLHAAAYLGDLDTTQELLRQGVEPDFPSANGETPLHVAVRWDHLELARLLLKGGARIDAQDRIGETPLHTALRHRRPAIAEWLRSQGADQSLLDIYGKPAGSPLEDGRFSPAQRDFMVDLASAGNTKVLSEQMRAGLDVNMMAKESLLHAAVRHNRIEAARLLLAHGALPATFACPEKETPLHLAARKGYEDVAKLLLEHAAPIDRRDFSGRTPLHCAILKENPAMVDFLCRSGADAEALCFAGETESSPLELAIKQEKGAGKIVKILLRFEAVPRDSLVNAALACDRQLLEVLLREKTDPRALHAALHRLLISPHREKQGAKEVENLLLDAGADLDKASWDWSYPGLPTESLLTFHVTGNGQGYVRLTAQEAPGFECVSWKIPSSVTETVEEDNGRTVLARVDGGVFPMSQSSRGRTFVSMFVVPAPGWTFDHWEGNLPKGADPKAEELTALPGVDREITAVLRKEE